MIISKFKTWEKLHEQAENQQQENVAYYLKIVPTRDPHGKENSELQEIAVNTILTDRILNDHIYQTFEPFSKTVKVKKVTNLSKETSSFSQNKRISITLEIISEDEDFELFNVMSLNNTIDVIIPVSALSAIFPNFSPEAIFLRGRSNDENLPRLPGLKHIGPITDSASKTRGHVLKISEKYMDDYHPTDNAVKVFVGIAEAAYHQSSRYNDTFITGRPIYGNQTSDNMKRNRVKLTDEAFKKEFSDFFEDDGHGRPKELNMGPGKKRHAMLAEMMADELNEFDIIGPNIKKYLVPLAESLDLTLTRIDIDKLEKSYEKDFNKLQHQANYYKNAAKGNQERFKAKLVRFQGKLADGIKARYFESEVSTKYLSKTFKLGQSIGLTSKDLQEVARKISQRRNRANF